MSEKILNEQKFSKILDKQFIFIIGSPRSGTTWLQTMLGSHPSVCTTVELTLFTYYIRPWIKIWRAEAANIAQGRWHAGLPFLWKEEEFYEFLRGFIGNVYEHVLKTKPHATHILDKHPGYSFDVEDIHWLLPKSRFIHIIRDGRDVAVSMIAAHQKMGFGSGTIEQSAIEWGKHIESARKAGQYKRQYLEVKYEELLKSGRDVLKTIFDFCDLQVSEEQAENILETYRFENMKANAFTPVKHIKAPEGAYRKGKEGSWREEFSPLQKYLFHRMAGNMLEELEYAHNDWWADSYAQKLLLPIFQAILEYKTAFKTGISMILGPRLTGYVRNTIGRKNFEQDSLFL